MSDNLRSDKEIPPTLVELFKVLPRPGEAFDSLQRAAFLKACEAMFDVVYKYPRRGE